MRPGNQAEPGIAGLAAAIALGRTGHEVEVLERSPSPGEVGAGLAIWPNGGRALAALGLAVPDGQPLRRLELRSWRSRLLSDPPVGELADRYGHPLVMVHRAELHRTLLESAEGARIRYSTEADGFDHLGSTVRVTLRSGETPEADLLVGADGIRSSVRRGLLKDGEPRYSGATCWRGVTRFDLDPFTAVNWWGRGAEFGVFRFRAAVSTGSRFRTGRPETLLPADGFPDGRGRAPTPLIVRYRS